MTTPKKRATCYTARVKVEGGMPVLYVDGLLTARQMRALVVALLRGHA